MYFFIVHEILSSILDCLLLIKIVFSNTTGRNGNSGIKLLFLFLHFWVDDKVVWLISLSIFFLHEAASQNTQW